MAADRKKILVAQSFEAVSERHKLDAVQDAWAGLPAVRTLHAQQAAVHDSCCRRTSGTNGLKNVIREFE